MEAHDTSGKPWAVVTGESSGIGLELARQFGERGFDVLMVAEDEGIAAAAADVGGEAYRADLTRYDDVERLWSVIAASGRPIDALALNAGVGNAGAFVDTDLSD